MLICLDQRYLTGLAAVGGTEPLANALKQVVLQQQVIHADETPVTVMQMVKMRKSPKKGYVWAYASTQYNPSSGSDL